MENQKRPVVVIVGAGFGGLNAAKALRKAPVDIILIDKNNYHLFQPLLYQVATAGLSASDIAYPLRAIFRRQKNLRFKMTEVTGVDPDERVINTVSGPIRYDHLVLAPGGETNYFGMESVAQNGLALKDLDDSIRVRNHILKMFEWSTLDGSPGDCNAMRTFVIVGGGPTGVESAGALSELIRLVLSKDFPELGFENVRVVLLEATRRLLPGFPEDLSRKAAERLKEKHVEVRFNAAVEGFDGQVVTLKDGERIPAFTLVWAAGVKAAGLVDRLGFEQGRQGRIRVEPTLQLPGYDNVWVVGDAAYLEENGGAGLPMVAPVAIQQGKTAARNILNRLEGRPQEAFRYKDPGSLATIGRAAAVARIKGFKFTGFIAWLVWLGVHLFWLIGFRNRLLVLVNWAADYIFYERGVRLITPDMVDEDQQRAQERPRLPAEVFPAREPAEVEVNAGR